MPSKGNPYPSRESSPGREPSLPRQNNEDHKNPYSGGFVRDFILGPPKGSPMRIERPVAKKPEEPKSIFKRRKGGLNPNEVTAEFKAMTQFHTKMDSAQRLALAKELIKKYPTTELKDVIKQEEPERKQASLGGTSAERSGAKHRLEALKIFEKRKE